MHDTNKGFTGQYNDTLTGLDYYGARYYDQKVGVFLSADSMQGNLQGMNPYGYVSGNPETKNDPTGHCPWCIGAIAGAIVGAAVSYGAQVYNNYQNGSSNPWTSNIDWGAVGTGAVTGALIGATLGAAAPALAAGATAGFAALSGGVGLSGAATLAYAASTLEPAVADSSVAVADSNTAATANSAAVADSSAAVTTDSAAATTDTQYAKTQLDRAAINRSVTRLPGIGNQMGRITRSFSILQQADANGGIADDLSTGFAQTAKDDPVYGNIQCSEGNCLVNAQGKVSFNSSYNLFTAQKNGLPACEAWCGGPNGTIQQFADAYNSSVRAWYLDAHGKAQYDTTSAWSSHLRFTADGTFLAFLSLTKQGELHVCRFTTSPLALSRVGTVPVRGINDIQFSPANGLLAASLEGENGIGIYDLMRLKQKVFLPLPDEQTPGLLAFSPDGQWLVCDSVDGMVYVWSMQTYEMIASFAAHPGLWTEQAYAIGGLAWSPGGKLIATGGASFFLHNKSLYDYSVKLWNVVN